MMFLTLLFACGAVGNGGAGSELADTASDPGTDTSGDTSGDTSVDPSELHGTVPDEALPAPEFAATNRDGSARGKADITDGPTVMWFYPAAGTYG